MTFVVLALLAVAVFRLVQLQVLDHKNYAEAARENRIRFEPVPPPRGLVYSRNGKLLAENLPGYNLVLVPNEVPDVAKSVRALTRLMKIPPRDVQRFERLRRATPAYQPVPLLTDLDAQQLARFAVNRYRFPGVHIQARLIRHYPYGGLTADSVGYVGRINAAELKRIDSDNYAGTNFIGKSGLELEYQDSLHGLVGYRVMKVDATGEPLSTLQRHPPTPGNDLVLTLDVGLQRVAQQAMQGHQGAVVVMDPQNGAILALASTPSFNPNWFVNGISARRYHGLIGNSAKPLWNRALDAAYAPGSTIKPFIAVAALNAHVITPQQKIHAGPYYVIPGDRSHHKFWDWTPYGHGMTDLKKAIAQSVDTYFYPVAYNLGIAAIDKTLAKFGFGTAPALGLPGESAGILPSPAWKRRTHNRPWYRGDTVVMGIGQGYLQITPLQLASAVSLIAMRGHGYRPRLLRAIRDPIKRRLQVIPPKPFPSIQLQQPAYWSDVIAGMHAVTASIHGTAHRAFLGFPLPVAGKTGTAQIFGFHQDPFKRHRKIPYRLRDNALFEGFTPIKHPQLAVVVVVEHAGDRLGPASIIARKIMDYWYGHRAQMHRPLSQLVLQPIATAKRAGDSGCPAAREENCLPASAGTS